MATIKSLVVPPLYSKILSNFPSNLSFCFAYGSGVKKQTDNVGPTPNSNVIDLVFCVDNAYEWHERNLQLNKWHYSGLKYLGHHNITKFQRGYGAKVYFNTLIPLEEVTIKYGVVSRQDLITDLLEWSDLYLAGRLHKPVEIVIHPTSSELQTAIQLNLQSAVHASLLILPETFTEYQFYHTVANLSYAGDFRMIFGENKQKVDNIVRPQLLKFRDLYKPFLKNLHDYVDFPVDTVSETETVKCLQDVGPLSRLHHLNQLPRWPQKALTKFWNRGTVRQDTEDVLRAIAYDPDCNLIVNKCVNGIVWQSSISQSLKSALTAGVVKSLRYSAKKITKMLR
uniref:Phosphatidate cytidylyltransferase, mitochondrial n=1 Tax=Photinus pyralis TaxID=7054 RepID=A0A1Y1KUE2_PHOPY